MTPEGYRAFVFVWIALAVLIFFVLLRVTAPYGRHTSAAWGPQIDNRLGWICMELPVLLALAWYVIPEWRQFNSVVWIMIALFCAHYIHRTLIFPFRLRTSGKKMPVVIVMSGVLFNIVNGGLLGYYFSEMAVYPLTWVADPRWIAGIGIFLAGMYLNIRTDYILIGLRAPGETGYTMPRGGWFEYVSCPNLFGELVGWLGYAILCWNLPALAFFIWTAANLIPRAISHHRWYKNKFQEYPPSRKAIIPYLV